MGGVEMLTYAVVVGAAVLVFLSLLADDLTRSNAELSSRHRAWQKKQEEEGPEPVMTATVAAGKDEASD